ncbi:MAG: UdgX family uracil-DNA binding protein [Planctomycetales bacterium]|nr:UdgX family uracil-DNA binding protein [Planctomycetales bacterium]
MPATSKRSVADYLPAKMTLPSLREAAMGCHGCDLYKRATQTVFGEGPKASRLMLVGETPGDQEDLQGKPFVGPAGRLLDDALEAVGLDRSHVYVTNAVKHFKWEERGKKRLHKKPGRREVVACRAWLEAEIFTVQPELIVTLGATAAQSLLGTDFRISQQRGEIIKSDWAPALVATYHPSAILRAPTSEDRRRMREELVQDLRKAVKQLKK